MKENNFMKKNFLYITIFFVLLVAPFFFMFDAKKVEAQNGEMAVVEVLAVKSIKKEINIYRDLPGRINSFKIAEVRPQISGIILEKYFKEGSYVEEDQQLYEIDPEPFIANLKSAFANLKMVEAELKPIEAKFERYKKLVKINAVSKQEFEEIKAELASKEASLLIRQAELRRAEIEYDYTKVYSPISGKIGKSFVTEGALVQANQENSLAVITQLDPVYVDISIPSDDFFKIRNQLDKDNVKVELKISGQEKPYETLGELQFSESIVDQTTGSVGLRAIFKNSDMKLLPGLFVSARLILGKKDVILIPQNAATVNPDGSLSVWVIDDKNVVDKRKIVANENYDNYWIVENGLKENENVVLEGIQKISKGAKVSVLFKEMKKKKQEVKAEIKEKTKEKIDMKNVKNINLEEKIVKDYDEKLNKEDYQVKIDNFIRKKLNKAKKDFSEDEDFVIIEQKDQNFEEVIEESLNKKQESQESKI